MTDQGGSCATEIIPPLGLPEISCSNKKLSLCSKSEGAQRWLPQEGRQQGRENRGGIPAGYNERHKENPKLLNNQGKGGKDSDPAREPVSQVLSLCGPLPRVPEP